MEYIYFADYRSKLDDDNMLIIHVATNPDYMKNAKYKAMINGVPSEVSVIERNTIRARFCYTQKNVLFTCEYQFLIPVKDKFKKAELIINLDEKYNNYEKKISISGRRFRKMKHKVPSSIDTIKKENDKTRIIGWCADRKHTDIELYSGKEKIDADIIRPFRKDIADYYLDGECLFAAGFEIVIDNSRYSKVDIVLKGTERQTVYHMNLKKPLSKKAVILDSIKRASDYRKRYGFIIMIQKMLQKILGTNVYDYDKYIKDISPDKNELKEQAEKIFDKQPLFSIVVPVYRPDKRFFEEMIKSVQAQTYNNWELCIADGGGEGGYMDISCEKILKSDHRIKYIKLNDNLGISGNTNAALELSSGDYIVLGDHDDLFMPDALYECAKLINEHDDVEVIYTDEDKYDYARKKRIDPNFKPDFNLHLLRSGNYICHMFVFSMMLHKKTGGFNSEYDGAQDFDMILRCVEKAGKVYHIPKILYSWRCHANSTALNPDSKKYAYVSGRAAVEAHLKRCGIEADVSINEEHWGLYRIKYKLKGNPLISIIIPNMNHVEDLDKCIRSIEKQNYKNFEIIIVENNSNEETFEYYKNIKKTFDNISVVEWKDKGFNFSKINNFGVAASKGEYLLFLNNDTEMIYEDCLEQLLSYSQLPDIGIVGARLMYGDNKIQHAGVIVGMGGVAGHCFVGAEAGYAGYQAYIIIPREYSAVTAACMMVRKTLFDKAEGFEEKLAVAFNDTDLCLKIREMGYYVVYNPDAALYHYESRSRGYEDTPDKINRYQEECNYMVNKWNKIITDGDPYYNPNLTLMKHDFSLREI